MCGMDSGCACIKASHVLWSRTLTSGCAELLSQGRLEKRKEKQKQEEKPMLSFRLSQVFYDSSLLLSSSCACTLWMYLYKARSRDCLDNLPPSSPFPTHR